MGKFLKNEGIELTSHFNSQENPKYNILLISNLVFK